MKKITIKSSLRFLAALPYPALDFNRIASPAQAEPFSPVSRKKDRSLEPPTVRQSLLILTRRFVISKSGVHSPGAPKRGGAQSILPRVLSGIATIGQFSFLVSIRLIADKILEALNIGKVPVIGLYSYPRYYLFIFILVRWYPILIRWNVYRESLITWLPARDFRKYSKQN